MDLEKLFQDAGAAFHAGDLGQAERLLKKIDSKVPNQPAVLHLRGLVALRAKKSKIAIKYLKQAVVINPTPNLLNALGSAYSQSGALEDAIEVLVQAVKGAPCDSTAVYNLGNALKNVDRFGEALSYYQTAITIDPGFTDAYYNMGLTLAALWRFEEAIQAYDRCLELNPDGGEAMKNQGNALYSIGKIEEAVAQMEKAVALNPGDADGYYNLANILHSQDKYDRAFEAFEKALAIKPREKSYISNFALLLKDLGEVDAAIERLQSISKGNELSSFAHSNLIFCMVNSPDYGPEEILKEAKRWNKAYALPLAAKDVSHANVPDPERRLKIGYLSGDLRSHPVGFFMEPVFESHDKTAFEVHVYATNRKADNVTGRIWNHVDAWHDAAPLNSQTLAEAIRDEGIDILLDLSGHAAKNSLLTLAHHPAPVQILGCGHFCTSGLDCVDGLLSDRFETPEGTDGHYSEPLIRLPDDYICYRPPDYAAVVGSAPCLENGFVTFGCFNNLSKISGPTITLWAKILKQVPESQLLMNARALASERARARLISLFTDQGISEDQLLLEPGLPHSGIMAEPHSAIMADYGRVDISLDPFPYTGGLTTIEALWMGVPVVTLSGETFVARHSTSHLMNAGLVELVCEDPVAYVNKALDLAADFGGLNALRQSIRPKLAASPILDGERYTRNLELIFRQLWRHRCEQTSM